VDGVDVEIDADLPSVRFDRDALMQVLWNLTDNAVKYARDGSPRRIALRCRRHRRWSVRWHWRRGACHFRACGSLHSPT
jgi:signal transduction histidine kinase